MPRLNIYISDELDLALRTSPHDINVSKVCAAAIRAELASHTDERSTVGIFHSVFDEPGWMDRELVRKFGVQRAVTGHVDEEVDRRSSARDVVATWTAWLLERAFGDGMRVAIGGGVQMWTAIKRFTARNLAMEIWAIGYGHVDHQVPHAHPNALVTMLSLLYAPRSRARLVGPATDFRKRWIYPSMFPPGGPRVRRVIVGSCAPFDADSPYARVLGKEMTDFLMDEHVVGDYLGVFLTADGRLLEPYSAQMTVSHIPSTELRAFAKREDTMVVLAAGGGHKERLMRLVLEAQLCNCLVTDDQTAFGLLDIKERRVDDD